MSAVENSPTWSDFEDECSDQCNHDDVDEECDTLVPMEDDAEDEVADEKPTAKIVKKSVKTKVGGLGKSEVSKEGNSKKASSVLPGLNKIRSHFQPFPIKTRVEPHGPAPPGPAPAPLPAPEPDPEPEPEIDGAEGGGEGDEECGEEEAVEPWEIWPEAKPPPPKKWPISSGFRVEFGRHQFYEVPAAAILRSHDGYPVSIKTAAQLGKMVAANSIEHGHVSSDSWPRGSLIHPASIFALSGQIDKNISTLPRIVWYVRIEVEECIGKDLHDATILRHVPRRVAQELISSMNESREFRESSLVWKDPHNLATAPCFICANHNEKPLNPKHSGWEKVDQKEAPKSAAAKPKAKVKVSKLKQASGGEVSTSAVKRKAVAMAPTSDETVAKQPKTISSAANSVATEEPDHLAGASSGFVPAPDVRELETTDANGWSKQSECLHSVVTGKRDEKNGGRSTHVVDIPTWARTYKIETTFTS
jgi:hypothetical protein